MAGSGHRQMHRYSQSGWPTRVCICLEFLFSILDRGPLVPPFPPALKLIDCDSVNIVSFTKRRGFIDLSFPAPPIEHFAHFIRLEIEMPPVKMRDTADEITNIMQSAR
jgi:hypothetical protein